MARSGMMVGQVEHRVIGDMLEVGQQAPDFELLANDRSKRTLANYTGKVVVISTIPSIDTGVCSAQTRRFNQEAADLGDNIVVLTVSADTTFALKRFCGNEGIDKTETLSCYMDMKFAEDYGVYDLDWRVCQRAVFVVDAQGIVQYVEYVPIIGNEVNFTAALEKAKSLV
jgi:thiol peroxidase